MRESNRQLAVRWMEEVWNFRRDATIDEILADDVVGHMEGGNIRSPGEFRAVRANLLSAFPDLRISVEETVAEGDSVVVRWAVSVTHSGEGLGFGPSGRREEFRGMSWMKFKDGKVVESWDSWNQGALLDSLREAAK